MAATQLQAEKSNDDLPRRVQNCRSDVFGLVFKAGLCEMPAPRPEAEGLRAAGSSPAPDLVLRQLERDGHLVTTRGRRSPWKQILVQGLNNAKQPYACLFKAFVTARSI
jgi:hypothetical protein